MSVIVYFAGGVSIYVNEKCMNIPLRGCTLELFAYIFLNPDRELRREKLATLIWPDRCEETARNLLSTALWRVRKVLSEIDGLELQCGSGTVRGTYTNGAASDLLELVAAIRGIEKSQLTEETSELLIQALGNADLELLDGMNSEWVLIERERHVNLRVSALFLLLGYAANLGQFEKAIGFACRIMTIDPFRENVLRQLMWLYVQDGRAAHAIRQFDKYQTMLMAELNLKPMAETLELCALILDQSNDVNLRQTLGQTASQRRSVYDALRASAH